MEAGDIDVPRKMEEESVEQKFCPKIEATNNNMQHLSYEERLSIVENDVQSLYEFCLEKKFTSGEIHKCVANLYGPPKTLTKKAIEDTASTFFSLSALVALAAVLLLQPRVYNIAIVHAKLVSIKCILPYWDWASLYNEDCLIANHWLRDTKPNMTAEDCIYCNDSLVERVWKVKHSFVMEECVDGARPIVVTDTRKEWKGKELTIDEIISIYQHHPALSTSLGSCLFHNNAGFNDIFYDFFQAYVDKKLPEEWFANWLNCEPKAAKVIRRYYTRPYFLPEMMQLGADNLVIVASGLHTNQSYAVPQTSIQSNGLWVTVLSGSLRFTMSPNKQCSEKFSCSKEITVDVNVGETLFYDQEAWTSLCKPNDDGVTVAVGSTVVWDKI